MSPILFFTTKTTQPRPQAGAHGLPGNGALICSGLHFWRHFFVKHKILPNLVISNWLWWIMRVLLASQNWGNILNEWFKVSEFFLKEVKMEEETKEIDTRYVTGNLLMWSMYEIIHFKWIISYYNCQSYTSKEINEVIAGTPNWLHIC